jgi:hypothetical protein
MPSRVTALLVGSLCVIAWLECLVGPAAVSAASAGPSAGCGLHIAGHPGVSLELVGFSFTPSNPVRVDYTINGRDPHSTTVLTDAVGAFDLTIETGPTFTGVYDFVITDPRCTLTPSAIARAAAATPSPVLTPAMLTPPATDAEVPATRDVNGAAGWLIAFFGLTAGVVMVLARRRPTVP